VTEWADRTEEQRAKNKERCRRFYEENREHVKEYSRKWYSENRDRGLESRRKYADSTRGRAVALFGGITKRSKNGKFSKKEFEIDVTADWIQEKIESGYCEVTGIEFDLGSRGGKWAPFAPSVDRIDCSKGYTKDNCRVVCVIFNMARNQFTDEDVLKMARAMVAKHE